MLVGLGHSFQMSCSALKSSFSTFFPCSQILDNPGLVPGLNLSELLGQEANFSEMYRWVPAHALCLWEGLQLLGAFRCCMGWG